MLPPLPKILKILLHLIEFYATGFVRKKYIDLREIVQNLPSFDRADGTEPNGTLCEGQPSTFSLNIPQLSAHDSALTARDICLEVHVTV